MIKSKNIIIKENFNCEKDTNLDFQQLEKDWHNLLFHGDNEEVMIELLKNGFAEKIDLVYIDPPFDSAANYSSKVNIADNIIKKTQFLDKWSDDSYLKFIYERLILLKELLSEQGSIYLHCDHHKSHSIKLMMDEVFGEKNFRNEIIWHYAAGIPRKFFKRKHDSIFFYTKSDDSIFNEIRLEALNKNRYNKIEKETGRLYFEVMDNEEKRRCYLDRGRGCDNVWTYTIDDRFRQLNSQANERQRLSNTKTRSTC